MLVFDAKDRILKNIANFWEKVQSFLKFCVLFFSYPQPLFLSKNDLILSIKEV